jgi:hypothetical protein
LSDTSKLPLPERAKRYRELGREARMKAASSKGEEAQASFIKLAGQWEQLAREAESDADQQENEHTREST